MHSRHTRTQGYHSLLHDLQTRCYTLTETPVHSRYGSKLACHFVLAKRYHPRHPPKTPSCGINPLDPPVLVLRQNLLVVPYGVQAPLPFLCSSYWIRHDMQVPEGPQPILEVDGLIGVTVGFTKYKNLNLTQTATFHVPCWLPN